MSRPARILPAAALAVALLHAPAHAAHPGASEGPGAPPAVTWGEMSRLLADRLLADRDEDGRWILVTDPAKGGSTPAEAAAGEALTAAWDHIAWVASALLTRGMPQGEEGLPARIPDALTQSILAEPSLSEPLRRFTSAALTARGVACADCLEGLRPSREVQWEDLRSYLGAFIHVRSVGEDGRIDFRVGTLSTSLPDPDECDLDLAAAAHAIMRSSAMNDTAVQQIIGAALKAELEDLGGFPPEVLERKLNESIALMVLTDPVAMRPILDRTPEALDLHGLRCGDCASILRGRR